MKKVEVEAIQQMQIKWKIQERFIFVNTSSLYTPVELSALPVQDFRARPAMNLV